MLGGACTPEHLAEGQSVHAPDDPDDVLPRLVEDAPLGHFGVEHHQVVELVGEVVGQVEDLGGRGLLAGLEHFGLEGQAAALAEALCLLLGGLEVQADDQRGPDAQPFQLQVLPHCLRVPEQHPSPGPAVGQTRPQPEQLGHALIGDHLPVRQSPFNARA